MKETSLFGESNLSKQNRSIDEVYSVVPSFQKSSPPLSVDHTLKLKLRRNLLRPPFQPPLTFLPGLEVADRGSGPASLATAFCQSRKLRHPLKLILSSAFSAEGHNRL